VALTLKKTLKLKIKFPHKKIASYGCFNDNYYQLTELKPAMVTSLDPSLWFSNIYAYFPTTNMTIPNCISICSTFMFKYAGLNAGYNMSNERK
jgi:hypothetical protein